MLKNDCMFVVCPFQISLLFGRTNELHQIGSAQFRSCCKQAIANSISSRVRNRSFFSSAFFSGVN